MNKVPLSFRDITLGEPLPYSIYSRDGKVYFHKGYVFSTETSVKRLNSLDLYRDDIKQEGYSHPNNEDELVLKANQSGILHRSDHNDINIFSDIGDLADQLYEYYYEIRHGHGETALPAIEQLCQKIKNYVAEDENKCLGVIHFYRNREIAKLLPVFATLLCDIIATDFGLSRERIDKLLMAAATAYLVEHRQNSEQLFDAMESEKLLRQYDIFDNDWLDIILLYGKADKLLGNHVELYCIDEINILNVVNDYLSLILPLHKESLSPRNALRNIFQKAKSYNERYYLFLIKQVGIYPPGSFVELSNGEIGIIIDRDKSNTLNTYIKCFRNKKVWFSKPVIRDGRNEEHSVQSVHDETRLDAADIIKIWES